jgi:hypothetical protein
MGKRKNEPQQGNMWVATQDLPRSASHPFYKRLNQILNQPSRFRCLRRRAVRTILCSDYGAITKTRFHHGLLDVFGTFGRLAEPNAFRFLPRFVDVGLDLTFM